MFKRTMLFGFAAAIVAAVCLMGRLTFAADAPSADKPSDDASKAAAAAPAAPKAPEFIKMDKSKMPPVNFPHAKHGKMFACDKCHGGKAPLFAQKRSEAGMKMADMYAGKGCGSCHDGKATFGEDDNKKTIFAAKTGCMKCHKAAPKTDAATKPAAPADSK
jgi:c(7)-type cytochrome triheme protein